METPVEREVTLHGERVTVERRAPTTTAGPVPGQFEERVVEVHELDEVPLVQKTAHVAEEVVIRREPTERTETVRDTVRREEVEVTPDQPDHRSSAVNVVHIIGTIIIGFLAGVVAELITPGRDPGGFIVTTLLGIVGAFVATYLGQAIGWYRADEAAGFIGAVIGAVILLAIYHLIRGRTPSSRGNY